MRHPNGRTRLGTRVALLGSIGALAAASACGGVSAATTSATVTPQASLARAVSALGNSTALTTTLRVEVSRAQLSEIAAASGHRLPAALSALVPTGRLVIAEETTNGHSIAAVRKEGAAGAADMASDLSLLEHGSRVLDVRTVNDTLYAHADVSALFADLGPAARAKIGGLQAKLPAPLGFVHTLLAGGWVSLPLGQLGALAPGAGSAAASLPGTLAGILSRDVTVVSTKPDHYTLSANLRTVVTDIVAALRQASPAAAGPLGDLNPSSVPSKTLTLQASTRGGVLQTLVFNAAQLEPAALRARLHDMPAPVELDFTRSAPTISAPHGAQPVNLSELLPLLAGLGQHPSA